MDDLAETTFDVVKKTSTKRYYAKYGRAPPFSFTFAVVTV